MSGFLFGMNRNYKDEILASAKRLSFLPNVQIESFEEGLFSISSVRLERKSLWGGAEHIPTGIRVFLGGRIALEEEQWESVENNQEFCGGLACRWLLKQYLEKGTLGLTLFNGPGVVILWDPREKKIFLVTDRMGFFPVFGYRVHDPSKAVVCTHPDVIANIGQVSTEYDMDSFAQYLAMDSCIHPRTYYKEIKQFDPGTIVTWDLNAKSHCQKQYWIPDYPNDDGGSQNEHIERLENAIRRAINLRSTKRLGPVILFLSGGSDSRALLFACKNRTDLIGVTFCDEINREVQVAGELAESAGIKHIVLRRNAEFYPDNAQIGIKIAGGAGTWMEFHQIGFLKEIMKENPGSILSGQFVDTYFKGHELIFRPIHILGRRIPLKQCHGVHSASTHRVSQLGPKWAIRVEKSLEELYSDTPRQVKSILDEHLRYDKRARPACRKMPGFTSTLWKTLPYDIVIGDNEIIDCFVQLPIKWHKDGIIWTEAVKRICAEVQDIPNANTGQREDKSLILKKADVVFQDAYRRLKRRREKKIVENDSLVTEGSWPNFKYMVANSKGVANLWKNPTIEARDLITDILETDPWKISLDEWSKNDFNQFSRIMTLQIWLSQ